MSSSKFRELTSLPLVSECGWWYSKLTFFCSWPPHYGIFAQHFVPIPEPKTRWQPFPKMTISGSDTKGQIRRVWKQQKFHSPNRIKKVHLATIKTHFALAGVAQWIEQRLLWNKGSPIQFPVRAHAWVAGQLPSGVRARGNHTLMFLPLFLLPFLSLKINKILKKK